MEHERTNLLDSWNQPSTSYQTVAQPESSQVKNEASVNVNNSELSIELDSSLIEENNSSCLKWQVLGMSLGLTAVCYAFYFCKSVYYEALTNKNATEIFSM